MNRRNVTVSYLTKGGIFTALGVIFIYLSTLVPVNKLYLLIITSAIIPLSVMTTNIRTSVVVYFAITFLALLICGVRASIVLYAIFFGPYGILKYYIEKLMKLYIEIILKFIFFNIALFILLLGYRLFFMDIFTVNLPIYALILGSEIVFYIYDYALTLFIYSANKILKKNYY